MIKFPRVIRLNAFDFLIKGISCALVFLLPNLSGCTSFNHLTMVSNEGDQPEGPAAVSCGSCHVDQYAEWRADPHSLAFVNPDFQEGVANEGDEDCIGCHAPLSVWNVPDFPIPRRFNREEGVSCFSCHLREGKMAGPQEGSALFFPHPITRDGAFLQSAMCGVCHQEVFSAWRVTSASRSSTSTCQQCHMPAVFRKSTKGTNPFSRLLVLFEERHEVRGHTFQVAGMMQPGKDLDIEYTGYTVHDGRFKVYFVLRNGLPHYVPAVSFGTSQLVLRVSLSDKDGEIVWEEVVAAAGGGAPVIDAGATRDISIAVFLPSNSIDPDNSSIYAELRLMRPDDETFSSVVLGNLQTALRP